MEHDEEHLKVVELIKNEFSVEEDVLLIDTLEVRRQVWEDVYRSYIKKKSQFNKMLVYNKEPQPEPFNARLKLIKNADIDSHNGMLFHFLKKYCIRREPSEKKESILEKAKLKRWLQENPVGKRQQQKMGSEKLQVTLIGKNFGKTTIHTYKKPLVEVSDVIKAMVDNSEDGTIILSEKTYKYANFDNFNHFHPDIFIRFIIFCVNDVFGPEYNSVLDARHKDYLLKMENFRNECYLTLDANERAHLRVLAQQKREEQQKEWAHWDAITPLAVFLNNNNNTNNNNYNNNYISNNSSKNNSRPQSSKSRNTHRSYNNNNNNNNNYNNIDNNNIDNNNISNPKSKTTRSNSLAKSERFGELSYTSSSQTTSDDFQEISAKHRKVQAQRYTKIKNILSQHYKQQKEYINEVITLLIKRHLQKMEDKKAEAIQQYNYIFNKKQVVQLLILAEDLICEDLRQSCIQSISLSLDSHINSAPLRCMLLREETYVSILSRLSLSLVMTIVPGSSIPSSIVERELSYRKLLIKDKVDNMSFEELQKVSDQYDHSSSLSTVPSIVKPFVAMIDIVKEDLSFRRETYPIVSLLQNNLPDGIFVENDFLTVSALNQKRYSVAYANHAKQYIDAEKEKERVKENEKEKERERGGKWYFEVSVLSVDESTDGCISIGWDSPRTSGEKRIPGLHEGFENKFGYCIQIDGIMHFEGKGHYFGPKYNYKRGDTIGCGIDQFNNFLSFYKNGSKISNSSHHGNFKLQPSYELVPCVCFYSRNESKVKFNFAGPFVALPLGFKAYGRSTY